MNKATLPKLPTRFFRWFCRESLQESILGDLEEQYDEDIEKSGKTKANWNFTWNVIRFCRSGIRKPLSGTYKLNHYGIFKNYFKTSLRRLNKNRLFSSINIVGLAISMSVGILMIVFLSEIYSYDDFHAQKDNIYRVTTHYNARGRIGQVATSSHYIGHQLQAKVPGVDKMLILLFDGSPSKKIVLNILISE